MNKVKTLSLILLLAFAGFVHCQSYNNILGSPEYTATTGAMYRHIFVGAVYIIPTGATTNVAVLSVNTTLPNGIFDVSQTISYATAITNIEGSVVDTASNQLTLQVENVTINAARTQFTTFVRFNREGITTFSAYSRVGFKVILIGSNFNVESGAVFPSAFVRNGKLTDVSTIPANIYDSAQFDFSSNTGQPSPFAFKPTASRCGVIPRGGSPTIQVLGCAKTIMLTFVTGYVLSNPISGSVYFSSFIVQDRTVTVPPSTVLSDLQLQQTHPNYLYQAAADDTIYGPTVMFKAQVTAAATSISKIQLSLIFVGLNQFTAATYPVSSTDAFIVAVGGRSYPIVASTLTTAAAPAKDGLITTNTNLNVNLYNPNTNMGHLFCGLTALVRRRQTDIRSSLIPGGSANVLNLLDAQATGTTASSAACILFATKSSCTTDQKQVLTSTTFSSTGTTTSTTVPLTITSNNLGSATGFSTPKNLYSFTISGYNNLVTTASITKNYTIPNTVSEVVIYLQFTATGGVLTGAQIKFTANIAGTLFTSTLTNLVSTFTYYVHVPLGTTLVPVTVTIQTIGTGAGGTTSLNLFKGLSYQNIVYNTFSCGASCPEATGKTTGVDPTTNPPTCIYCDTSLNKFYLNGFCVCKDYFFLAADNTCQPCSDPLCITCTSAGPATCSICAGNTTLSAGSCACNNGFYRNGSICLPCPIGCATCSSPTACTACQNSINVNGTTTRSGVSGNCACLPGFFEVNTTAVCSPCSSSCTTCSGTALNCLSCNTANNFILNQNTCTCQNGFYQVNNNCIPCNPVCATCAISSVYCTSCPALRVLAGTVNPEFKTCNCNASAGYIQLNYVCVDASCSNIDPKCQTCTIDAVSLTSKQCLNCIDNRIVVNGVCVCKPGYFQNANGTCAPCGVGCQQCTNATTCQSCATGSISNGDGTCTCRSGLILVSFSASLYCQPCSTNCTTCSIVSTNCTSCRPGFNVVNGQCVCPAGTFTAPDGSRCVPCSSQCLACTSPTSCSNCATGYIFDTSINQCALNCPSGTFNAGTQCTACPTGCISCYTQSICSSCAAGLNMFAGSCRSACPETTYASNGQCLPCNAKCKTCTSLTQCNSCNAPFVLLANQCVDDCSNGTYFIGGSCLACNISCATCSGTANTCTSCAAPQILYNGACYNICPVAVVNGICTNNCPIGTYLSGTNCAPCDSVCRTCSVGPSNCTSCATSLSYNGACVNNCPPGTTAINGFCSNCDTSCLLCAGTIFNCTQCARGYVRSSTGGCTNVCPPNFYVDLVENICSPCGTGCQQCTSLTQCNGCVDQNLTPLNGVCQRTCPAGANLVGNICICSFGVLQNSVCVSSCSNGFYAGNDRQCLPCTSPCLTCSGSPTSCSSCIAGFNYDAVNRVCNPSSACPYGAYLDTNGVCQRYCPFSYFLGGCIFQCPAGYQANAFNGCILSSSPTFCQAPLIQFGSSCVNSCPTGYTPNLVTRNCDQCLLNCLQCLSSRLCTSCAAGYILNNDQTACIVSSSCPAGQFQYRQACYSICPIGTFQQNQICVRSCPANFYFFNNFCYPTCFTVTQFYTPDACFNQCPANTPNCLPANP